MKNDNSKIIFGLKIKLSEYKIRIKFYISRRAK